MKIMALLRNAAVLFGAVVCTSGVGMSQPAATTWPEVLASLARVRTRAETCTALLKQYGDKAQIERGNLIYAQAKAEADAAITELIVDLDTGQAPQLKLIDQTYMKNAISGVAELCNAVVVLVPSAQNNGSSSAGDKVQTFSENTKVVIDVSKSKSLFKRLGEHLSDPILAFYRDRQSRDALTRRTIRIQLERMKWPSFNQASEQSSANPQIKARQASRYPQMTASKDFQAFLGAAAVMLGGMAGFFALLDWLLSKEIKGWIEDKASTAWIWLSYQRTWPLVRKLQAKNAFGVFLAIGIAICILQLIVAAVLLYLLLVPPIARSIIQQSSLRTRSLVFFVASIFLLLLLAPSLSIIYIVRARLRRVYVWITTTKQSSAVVLIRTVGVLVVIAILYYISVFSSNVLAAFETTHPMIIAIYSVIYTIFILALIFTTFATVALCIYVLCIYALIFVFKLAQAVILRIAEYDKGPVLAVAALLTAVGSILTAFSHSP
jgi:hypothetical protein